MPGDEMAVARVHVRSWQVGYRGLLSAEYLEGLRAEDRARRYTFGAVAPSFPKTLVATDSDLIRGIECSICRSGLLGTRYRRNARIRARILPAT